MVLEKYLIEHCAPTLASLKTASLMSLPWGEEMEHQILRYNEELSGKGVEILVLRQERNRALVYVYRKKMLEEDLKQSRVRRILCQYGYKTNGVQEVLEGLANRLSLQRDFPHEIGLFLGYPPGDVEGFIQNCGRNCKCSGCWKVYCDEYEARRTFARYAKCRRIYGRLWREGRSIRQLTVVS